NLDDGVIKEEDEKHTLPGGSKDDITYSPNERYAAYTRGNNLFAYDTEQGKEIQLTHDGNASILNGKMTWVYWEELHYRRGYKAFYWSPNNDSLAYLQFDESSVSTYPVTDFSKPVPETRNMAYPKVGTKNPSVRLGVVSLSTRDTRWIDLGEPYEYIARVEWRPDGEVLAVQTLNRAQNRLTLLYADPYTGRSRIILEETDDAWVNAHGGPYYVDDEGGDFLWLSERSGYRHLYRYSHDGKKVKQLTKGEWEVNPSLWEVSVPIDKKNRRIFFTALKDAPLETHLYSVPFNGGRVQRLTNEPGNHQASFSEDMQYAVRYFTSLKTPYRIDVIDRRGKVIRTLGETTLEDYAPYQVQIPELVEIKSPEGITYYGRILKPYDFDPGKKYPTIVYMYGGPAGQVVGNHFVSDTDLAMVNRGFVLFSFDTRGTAGRGREWINAIHRNACDIPLQDLQFAKEYLQTIPYVDADHLGIWGWSNGGYMTCCAMLKIPGTFQAGAAVAPVTDYHLYDTIYTERYMGLPDENLEGYKESSAVNFADGLQGKLMIAHGVSDDNVH
ncbi:MAG: S9 family peptidase, partial [Candidatus Hinthialibacter sp.]